MKLRLQTLFFLVAVAALACVWFLSLASTTEVTALIRVSARRQLPLGRRTFTPTSELDFAEFESAFYRETRISFRNRNLRLYQKMVNPDEEIRGRLQIRKLREKGGVIWLSVEGCGNPLTTSAETTKSIFDSALIALASLRRSHAKRWKINVIANN